MTRIILNDQTAGMFVVPDMPDIDISLLDSLPYDIEPQLSNKHGIRYQRHDTCFFSNVTDKYRYSGTCVLANPLDTQQELIDLLKHVNQLQQTEFNSILIKRYRDGTKYVSPHSYLSSKINTPYPVCHVFYGEPRLLRIKSGDTIVVDYTPEPRELIVTASMFQHYYSIQIPKRTKIKSPSYVLTLLRMKISN